MSDDEQKMQRGVLVSLSSLHQIRQALQVISFLTEVSPALVAIDTGRKIRQQVQSIDAALTTTVYENRV